MHFISLDYINLNLWSHFSLCLSPERTDSVGLSPLKDPFSTITSEKLYIWFSSFSILPRDTSPTEFGIGSSISCSFVLGNGEKSAIRICFPPPANAISDFRFPLLLFFPLTSPVSWLAWEIQGRQDQGCQMKKSSIQGKDGIKMLQCGAAEP